jgi:hypothetical protein
MDVKTVTTYQTGPITVGLNDAFSTAHGVDYLSAKRQTKRILSIKRKTPCWICGYY